jgi:hypothetical protein
VADKKVIEKGNPRLEVKVSPKYSRAEKQAIANDIRLYLIERTQRGLGKGAKPWSGKAGEYSKAYKESIEFKAAGKGSTVDLRLSSEMLGSLQATVKGSRIVIEPGEDQKGKAEGNIRGTYGNKSPIPGKRRNFLDISGNELKSILSAFPLRSIDGDSAKKRQETVQAADQAATRARSIVDELLGEIDD